jgi:hypothetical protein
MQTWYMSAGTPARTASTSEANTIPRSASESAIAEMPTFFKTIDAPKKKWELRLGVTNGVLVGTPSRRMVRLPGRGPGVCARG